MLLQKTMALRWFPGFSTLVFQNIYYNIFATITSQNLERTKP